MARHERALELLKEKGYRLTPQRLMVITAIGEQRGHLAVEKIHQRVKQVYPYIDIATVYRTLQLLKRLHLVTEIEAGGSSRYELAEAGGHHHMVCLDCGRAFDLSPRYLEEFRRRLIEEFGFEPDLEHFAIEGRCAECASRH
jgi:Fur family ferric uptake transcriptional regulator